MYYRDLIAEYARRLGIPQDAAAYLADQLCEEILRQLILGQEVSLPSLGKFSVTIPKVGCRTSNLPHMRGKLAAPKVRKRLVFKAYPSAHKTLTNRSLLSAMPRPKLVESARANKARKEAMVAKEKEGEHRTIDVPAGVRQITINLPDAPKKKKKSGKGESGNSKRKLLG